MKRYKVVTIHSGAWIISCDCYECRDGYVRFECVGCNVAIFKLDEVVGIIEEYNGQ